MAADAPPAAVKTTVTGTFSGLLKYSQVEAPSGFSQLLGNPNLKMMLDKYELVVATSTTPISYQLFAANDNVSSQLKALKGKTVLVLGTVDTKDGTIRDGKHGGVRAEAALGAALEEGKAVGVK